MAAREALPAAKAAATKALELDNTLGEAHTSLGFALSGFDWDWASAEKEFRRAIDLNPGYATGHHWYAWHLSLMGRHGEAIAEMRQARSLDPLSLIINADLAEILLIAHFDPDASTRIVAFVLVAPSGKTYVTGWKRGCLARLSTSFEVRGHFRRSLSTGFPRSHRGNALREPPARAATRSQRPGSAGRRRRTPRSRGRRRGSFRRAPRASGSRSRSASGRRGSDRPSGRTRTRWPPRSRPPSRRRRGRCPRATAAPTRCRTPAEVTALPWRVPSRSGWSVSRPGRRRQLEMGEPPVRERLEQQRREDDAVARPDLPPAAALLPLRDRPDDVGAVDEPALARAADGSATRPASGRGLRSVRAVRRREGPGPLGADRRQLAGEPRRGPAADPHVALAVLELDRAPLADPREELARRVRDARRRGRPRATRAARRSRPGACRARSR